MGIYIGALVALAVGAVVWPQVARNHARWAGWLSSVVPLVLAGCLVSLVGTVGEGSLPQWQWAWVPEMEVGLDFQLDGVSLLLAILVAGIGGLILIYGGGYLAGTKEVVPFFGFIHLFMLAMLGVVAADHLLVLFVFWELTSLTSYLLIGLAHEVADSRKAALRALLVTGIGGVAMLAGFIMLAESAGTWRISEMSRQAGAVLASPSAGWIFGLILLGALTKSAQVPFHFWLPGAMTAPTPVSAYLHSATMVKAGIFLLAKLSPVFGAWPAWGGILMPVGAVTMLTGSLLALAQTDLKKLLAYSTMSALGTLVLLLGIGTELAVQAAMVFLVVHALYKASLFMVVGVVDKATGTRDITVLHGLGKQMPLVALAAGLAAFSMSGVPPFIGFIGKELLYEAKVQAQAAGPVIIFCGFAANAINVAIALKVGFSPFVRRGEVPTINPKAKQTALLAGPLLLALLGVVIGVWPDLIGRDLIRAAVRDVTGSSTEVKLKLWHGFNMVLLLSAVTVAVGGVVYGFRTRVRATVATMLGRAPTQAAKLFDSGVAQVVSGAGMATRVFQHGNLRGYFLIMLASVAVMAGLAVMSDAAWVWPEFTSLRLVPTGICLMMLAATVMAVRAKSGMTALLALGGVGYGIALLYALFGAPDLSLTQVLVETLTLVMFAFVMRKLPPIRELSGSKRRWVDGMVAVAAGLAVTIGLLAANAVPAEDRISETMSATSYTEANGKNVVNVILVDFRALDTLGEITVLAIAALGVAALLYGQPSERPGKVEVSALYRASVRWLSPLLVGLSILLLVRGHNEPGGGFIGGLVIAAAAVLRQLGESGPLASPKFPTRPLVALGLAVSAISALPAVVLGRTFMQGVWFGEIYLPLVGVTKLGTPFIFDIGVYLVVFGVARWILTSILESRDLESEPAT